MVNAVTQLGDEWRCVEEGERASACCKTTKVREAVSVRHGASSNRLGAASPQGLSRACAVPQGVIRDFCPLDSPHIIGGYPSL
jgi:hypothetical protein